MKDSKPIIRCDYRDSNQRECKVWFTESISHKQYLEVREGERWGNYGELQGTTCKRCNIDLCMHHATVFKLLTQHGTRTEEIAIGPICCRCKGHLTQLIESDYLLQILDLFMKQEKVPGQKELATPKDFMASLREFQLD